MMPSVDYAAEGKKYLEQGLKLVRNGDIDNAIECFYHAAVAFDRAQYSKLIPTLWETIGNLLEPSFKEYSSKYFEALQKGNIQEVDEKWYQFPLAYHIKAASYFDWKKQNDPIHKQAWVYEWAAEQLQHLALYEPAYTLFFRAAEKAEQTKTGKAYPGWPAKLYQRAILNFIRSYGTIEHAPIKHRIKKDIPDKEMIEEGLKRMEKRYVEIKDQAEAYGSLAMAYRLFKSALLEGGNLTEAERFKIKERSALMRYYFYKRNYFRAILEWLSGPGFKYFILVLLVITLFIFPCIYYKWNLVAPVRGKLTYLDAIFYSIGSALNIGHSEFYAVGSGKFLNILQAAFSWLALGMLIWWLTRRLE